MYHQHKCQIDLFIYIHMYFHELHMEIVVNTLITKTKIQQSRQDMATVMCTCALR